VLDVEVPAEAEEVPDVEELGEEMLLLDEERLSVR
jgi:hypothetical protein